MRQTYRQEEAEQILREAVRRTAQEEAAGAETVFQERFLAMAEELGIEPTALEAVLRDRETQQTEQAERQEFIALRRSGFWSHLWSYVGVNTILSAINFMTDPGYWWAFYALLGWGIGLFSHAMTALPTKGTTFEQAFQQWREGQRAASSSEQTPRQREMKTILGSFTVVEPTKPRKPRDPQRDSTPPTDKGDA